MPEQEKKISETLSLCPECGGIIPARIYERDGCVYQRKTCPQHGDFEFEIHYDSDFFMRCARGTTPTPAEFLDCDVTGCLGCERHKENVKTVMIDVTERCNMNCPACFTNTHSRKSRDPSIQEITDRLVRWKSRPTILLCGGEPTVREDLPELISAITSLGFVVKVASNGINLGDREYVAKLREAGLGWVLFQFDGFSDDIYEVTRGRPMMDIKREALDVLRDSGIKVCLACMVVRGVNDGELGKMVDYMMESDFIMHIGCTVLSCVGRDDFGPGHRTTAKDVLEAVERGTGGGIRLEDFMHTRRIGKRLFALTGNRDFQQKSCFHMLLLHRRRNGYIPVNRYFSLGGALANAGGLAELALLYGSLRHWDAISMTGKVKLMTVEEFRAHDTVDLVEANRCNKVYMAERGYVPPCIYNTKYRPQCWLVNDPAGSNKS